ncbi:MAG: ATP-binding protein, partial [Polyangiaceae bacterium]
RKIEVVRRYRDRYPANLDDASVLAHAIRAGEPQLHMNSVPPSNPEQAALFGEIGIASSIIIPLVIRGRVIGTMSLARGPSARPFTQADLEVSIEVGRRAAISIDNARLYQKALDEEARLRVAMDAGGMGSWEWDIVGERVSWSPSLEKIHGIPAGSFGGTFEDYQRDMHPDDRARVLPTIQQTLAERKEHRVSYRIIRPDGEVRWIEAWGKFVLDEAGVPVRLLGVCMDITERKVAEEKRQREDAKRDFIAEATAALSSSLDYRTTLTAVARLAVPTLADWCSVHVVGDDETSVRQVAVTHVDPAKVAMAESLGKRYPPDPNAITGVPNVLRTGRSELYTEIPQSLLAAGAVDAEHLRLILELRLESAMVVPLVARGRTLGAMTFIFADSGRRYTTEDLAFAEDLARRAGTAMDNARLYDSEQKARRHADEANRAKDEFLATVSHELRTPLNAMLGWTRMLRTGDLPRDKHDRALEVIERNTLSQAQLVEDLLDIARIVSGKLRLNVQSVPVVNAVEQAVDSLRLAVDAKSIHLEMKLDADAGEITGDPTRLQQIVWNLLSNAIKFTPKEGRIQILLERGESSVTLEVTDDGKGISPAFLPYVFDRFRQADGGITRTHGGLGLGLAISRHLVELHGGTMEVSSPGEGKGATFKAVFPISQRHARDGVPVRQRTSDTEVAPSPALKGLRVLVVDDEADTRDLLVAILERGGAVVTTASSLATALAAIDREIPDVLLSDVAMPDGDGYQLIEAVRKLPPERGGSIPAAALTAYARAEDRRRALNAGYLMHVPKPVEPAEVVSVVANLARFIRW